MADHEISEATTVRIHARGLLIHRHPWCLCSTHVGLVTAWMRTTVTYICLTCIWNWLTNRSPGYPEKKEESPRCSPSCDTWCASEDRGTTEIWFHATRTVVKPMSKSSERARDCGTMHSKKTPNDLRGLAQKGQWSKKYNNELFACAWNDMKIIGDSTSGLRVRVTACRETVCSYMMARELRR